MTCITQKSDGESSLHSSSSLDTSDDFSFSTGVKTELLDVKMSVSVTTMSENELRHEGGGQMRRRPSNQSANNKDDKICRVCGDKALGCNFDAISCESCKAFFRRNATSDKKIKCVFNGDCPLDVNTRRFCPHCRLKKCFAIGMKKELILGENEKKKRKEKVKQKLVPVVSNETVHIVSVPEVSSVPTDVPPKSCASVSPSIPHVLPHMSLFELLPENTNLLSLSRLVQERTQGVTASLNTSQLIPSPSTGTLPSDCLVRTLTTEEESLLQELIQVYDLSFTVDLEPLIHITQLDPSLNQLVNQSSITVLRLIKFAKRLEEFVRLPQQCQIGILKGCWIHILLLRSVSLYDCERDVWATPRGDIPTEILKNATGLYQLHDDHVRYCTSIKSIIGDDLAIVVILVVVVMFSPEGPHVVMRDLVSNIQDRYLILLKHYLEAKYTYFRSAEMFPQLMSKVKELKEFAEVHGKCLVDINPREIEPIMLEILDLK